MRLHFAVVSALPLLSHGQKVCHAIDPRASDDWCTSNCNYSPAPNCPPSWCVCDDGPTPTPTPSPSPSPGPTPSPGPSPVVVDPVFQLDLFVNDPGDGWQADGFPAYMEHSAAKYMNVAGISFIQPSDLMNSAYDLPAEVANVVRVLRSQGVAVVLLVGGQIAAGWSELQGNPETAAANAIALMQKYDCGIEVDNEDGGATAGLIQFIQLCAEGRPSGTYITMDVAGTPSGPQRTVIQGAIDHLDWVNLMVSNPGYDQGNSVKFGHQYGVPYEKLLVAYYAGTWVNNCNQMDSGVGGTGAGKKLFDAYSLKGLSIWAVGGMSYHNCRTDDAPGFSDAMTALGAHPLGPSPAPTPGPTPPPPSPTPPPSPAPPPSPSPSPSPPAPSGPIMGFWDGWVGSHSSSPAPGTGWFFSFPGTIVTGSFAPSELTNVVPPPTWGTYDKKILTQGGGDTGWGNSMYSQLQSRLSDYAPAGWDGVCWDWETVGSDHTSDGLNTLMRAAKDAGLINILTSTAEGPYMWSAANKDATDIDWSLIDYFVPQMYGASGSLPSEWETYAQYWADGAGKPTIHDVTFAPIPMEKILWGMPSGTCSQADKYGGGGCIEWAYSPAVHPAAFV